MNNPICIDKFFQRIKNKYLYVFSIIILILGLLLNRYGGIQFSLLHELILTGLLCFQIIIIKKHLLDMNNLSSTTTNTMVLGCIKRFWDRQNSILSIFFIFIIALLFSSFIIALNYLPLSPLGIYGGLLALITLIIGLYGYFQYLQVLILLFDISNRINYSIEYPCIQNWFKQLNTISYRLSKSFLIFGVFYIIEYSLLIPQKSLQISGSKIVLNTHNNLIFITSWFSIILLIVVAFPVLVVARKIFLNNIIKEWKKDNITQIKLCIISSATSLSKNNDSDSIDNIFNIIKIYQHTQDLIVNLDSHSITSNTLTLSITTFLNISISILTILSQLKELTT